MTLRSDVETSVPAVRYGPPVKSGLLFEEGLDQHQPGDRLVPKTSGRHFAFGSFIVVCCQSDLLEFVLTLGLTCRVAAGNNKVTKMAMATNNSTNVKAGCEQDTWRHPGYSP